MIEITDHIPFEFDMMVCEAGPSDCPDVYEPCYMWPDGVPRDGVSGRSFYTSIWAFAAEVRKIHGAA